ncbi:MAG: glycosyltransferase [Actinobacteria bacterium]|uniref:Unannotated protein n=1 Tax=freshwater metagenome TaxID=449393 RepID=A0A6J7N6J3_9ZZZZ|nr:glycosyltransferase [Actinomycetota bacterium]MSZ69249.1 glycosyltransferase [Actinomycetota bacterium]MTA67088.1 glycosyltransferase [Actinomycetota bacterium]MTB16050.1 glycosyltransferase [Actinomycetota bacterium]
MHLLLVTPFLPPRIGGIERHSENLIREFVKSPGSEITVLTSNNPRWPVQERNYPRNVKIIQLRSVTLFGRLPIPLVTLSNFRKLRELRKRNFDRLIVQSHLFPISTISALIMQKVPSKIWINHGSGYITMGSNIVQTVEKFYENLQARIMSRRMNGFIAVSKDAATWISSIVKQNFACVPNGVPAELIVQRQTFPVIKGQISLLFVSRLLPGKGGIEAIKILEKLIEREAGEGAYSLTVIGEGSEEEEMQAYATSKQLPVIFLGALNHDVVIEQMRKCDVFIYPSKYPEGFPTVILEAIASGLLIASTSPAGLEVFIETASCIYGQESELASLLSHILMKPIQIINMIQSTQVLLRVNYTWDSIVKELTNPR